MARTMRMWLHVLKAIWLAFSKMGTILLCLFAIPALPCRIKFSCHLHNRHPPEHKCWFVKRCIQQPACAVKHLTAVSGADSLQFSPCFMTRSSMLFECTKRLTVRCIDSVAEDPQYHYYAGRWEKGFIPPWGFPSWAAPETESGL